MSDAVLVSLIGVFGGILSLFIKSFIDRKNTKKDLNKRDKNISDRLGSVENIVTSMNMKLGEHLSDDNFRNTLKNVIRIRISEIINNSRANHIHRNILFYFAEMVEEYGLMFYYSDFRKTDKSGKKDLRTYLIDSFEVRREKLKKFIYEMMPERKFISRDMNRRLSESISGLKVGSLNSINFHDLLSYSRTLAVSQLLIERLVRNGFTGEEGKKEVTQLFKDYVDDFCIIYLDTLQLWEIIPNMDE